jgi:hypothetical protein
MIPTIVAGIARSQMIPSARLINFLIEEIPLSSSSVSVLVAAIHDKDSSATISTVFDFCCSDLPMSRNTTVFTTNNSPIIMKLQVRIIHATSLDFL